MVHSDFISPQPLTPIHLLISSSFEESRKSEALLEKPECHEPYAELDSVSFQHLGPNHRFCAYREHYKTL